MVPFKVPVALPGYEEAMGLGWSSVWQTSVAASSSGWERYEDPTHRTARIDKNEKMKYCSRKSRRVIFGCWREKNARIGRHTSAMSRYRFNIVTRGSTQRQTRQ